MGHSAIGASGNDRLTSDVIRKKSLISDGLIAILPRNHFKSGAI